MIKFRVTAHWPHPAYMSTAMLSKLSDVMMAVRELARDKAQNITVTVYALGFRVMEVR
jgi:hypothetical protein